MTSEVEIKGNCRCRVVQDIPASELSLEKYHTRPEWSNSQVKDLPDNPERFAARYIHKWMKPDRSDEADKGTALHSLLLEKQPVEVIPADVLSASGVKAGRRWNEWRLAHPGLPLKQSQADEVRRMADSIMSIEYGEKLIEAPGETELSIFWRDETTGLDLRCRPDKIVELAGSLVIMDLKSIFDPTGRRFATLVAERGHHRQGAWYSKGVAMCIDPAEAFVFVAVRNKPPYEAYVWELSCRALAFGKEQNALGLADLKRRLDSGDWRGWQHNEIGIVDLPEWAYRVVS